MPTEAEALIARSAGAAAPLGATSGPVVYEGSRLTGIGGIGAATVVPAAEVRRGVRNGEPCIVVTAA